MIATKKLLSVLFIGALVATATATDYYVASDGTYDGAPDGATVYASLDEAIAAAGNAADVIHVEPGEYETSTQNGPNLQAKLVGTGLTRDAVVISAGSTSRTLKIASTGWLEGVTLVGESTSSTAGGGTVYMDGGTITNCVLKNGTSTYSSSRAGGNLYMQGDALVVDCEIKDGAAVYRGGNVYMTGGTLRKCVVSGGAVSAYSGDNNRSQGGNVWVSSGTIDDCTISGGSAERGGNLGIYGSGAVVTNCLVSAGTSSNFAGNIFINQGSIVKSVITNGTASASGGNVYMVAGNIVSSSFGGGSTSKNEGGNIYMTGGTVSNVHAIVANGTVAGSGGNIYMTGGTVVDGTLVGGTVGYYGGNVYMTGGTASHLALTGGVSPRSGGSVYMTGGVLSDSTVSGGTANGTDWAQGGGNVFMTGGGKLLRCTVTGGRHESGTGGGIRCRDAEGIVVEDCLVCDNIGGGVCLDRGNLYNCTIVKNVNGGVFGYTTAYGQVVNCVVYGNFDADGESPKEWRGNKVAANVFNLASSDAFGDSAVSIDSSAFLDYANGDYRPFKGSPLMDAGATDSRADVSTVDLDGNPRLSGTVDIGCYEYQHVDLTVSFNLAEEMANLYAPATASFLAETQNAAGSVSYTWDFGDGSEEETTDEARISHQYLAPGSYTVAVTATSGDETATYTFANCVSIVSKTVYVTAGNAEAAFPYSTPETGYATLSAAVADAVDGSVILVGDGLYEQTAPIDVPKAVTIKGNDANPAAVILRNTATASSGNSNFNRRVMTVSDAGAWISGLTMENGSVYCNFGANLYVSAGVVSNCVVRGGNMLANESNNAGCGGGVALADSGIVTHCVITNNAVVGTASDQSTRSAAVCFRYGSSGKLLNSLVAYNSYAPSAETAKRGTAGIFYGGNNSAALVENCTVVGNTVVGSISDQSAGMYCNAYTTIRNTVFAGNSSSDGGSAAFLISGVTVVNCATDGASPLNDSCVVGATDEMFKDFANGNLTPKAKGTLFAKGATPAVVASVDLAGNPRVMFDAIDIGCYECQTKPGFAIVVR